MSGPESVDWRSVAARVAAGDGAFYLLSTSERDALEAAVGEYHEARTELRLADVTRLHGEPPPGWLPDEQADPLAVLRDAAGVAGLDPDVVESLWRQGMDRHGFVQLGGRYVCIASAVPPVAAVCVKCGAQATYRAHTGARELFCLDHAPDVLSEAAEMLTAAGHPEAAGTLLVAEGEAGGHAARSAAHADDCPAGGSVPDRTSPCDCGGVQP